MQRRHLTLAALGLFAIGGAFALSVAMAADQPKAAAAEPKKAAEAPKTKGVWTDPADPTLPVDFKIQGEEAEKGSEAIDFRSGVR